MSERWEKSADSSSSADSTEEFQSNLNFAGNGTDSKTCPNINWSVKCHDVRFTWELHAQGYGLLPVIKEKTNY